MLIYIIKLVFNKRIPNLNFHLLLLLLLKGGQNQMRTKLISILYFCLLILDSSFSLCRTFLRCLSVK